MLVLALAFSTAQIANAQGVQPASFEHSEADRRLDSLVKFPDIEGKLSVMLNCFSRVKTSGKLTDTGCYTEKNYDQPFAAAVIKAAKKARMKPAIVGGKAREVYLQFRAEFIADGEKGAEKSIYLHSNPGYAENIEAYGYDYVAGQRVLGSKEPWTNACPKRAAYAVWARAYLGENGRADNPTIVHASGVIPTQTCQDAIKQTIVASLYTPAMADGSPVPSTFVELFGN